MNQAAQRIICLAPMPVALVTLSYYYSLPLNSANLYQKLQVHLSVNPCYSKCDHKIVDTFINTASFYWCMQNSLRLQIPRDLKKEEERCEAGPGLDTPPTV